ncbi:hypothetical protein AB0F43_09115 [Kribbella sp. NPDC023972]|uniref:hypothetical protein n=1 Tax=Kribbella sp. NPDC023972 TaxID=3154795 RepID=UPI0033CDAAFF
MPRNAKRASSPDPSGGDDARDLYDELTDDLLYDPAIGRSTMMGYPCIRLAGRFLASYDDKAGSLVVKLPGERVAELVRTGTGAEFAPAGKVFREWVAIPTIDPDLWRGLLAEAVTFARTTLTQGR